MFSQKQTCFSSRSPRIRLSAKVSMKCCVVKDVDPGETSEGIRKRRAEGAMQECDFKQRISLRLILWGALEYKLYPRVNLNSAQGHLGLQYQLVSAYVLHYRDRNSQALPVHVWDRTGGCDSLMENIGRRSELRAIRIKAHRSC